MRRKNKTREGSEGKEARRWADAAAGAVFRALRSAWGWFSGMEIRKKMEVASVESVSTPARFQSSSVQQVNEREELSPSRRAIDSCLADERGGNSHP